jgi:hypothetical protein
MDIHNLSVSHLKRAAEIKEQIERLSKELRTIFGSPANTRSAPKAKRPMSASARKKIAAAQSARWASLRRAKPAMRSANTAAKAKKKTMSPAVQKKD